MSKKSETDGDLMVALQQLEAEVGQDDWTIMDMSPSRLAEVALLRLEKMDTVLAKKFIVQADISSGCEPWALDIYRELTARSDEALQSDDPAFEDDQRPFKFLFVHSGQVGTTALQNFLTLHPQLLVTQKSEIDQALIECSETNLARRYNRMVGMTGQSVRSGIVQHGYVAGRRGGPDINGKQPGAEIVNRLAQVVDSDRFYHLVRDPLDTVRSAYNHSLVNVFGGGYSFPGSINFPAKSILSFGDTLAWPKEWEIPSSGRPKIWDKVDRSERTTGKPAAHFAPTEENRKEAMTAAVGRTAYAAVGALYTERFSDWRTVDFNDILPNGVDTGLPRLFEEIGVSPDYRHGLFQSTAMPTARRNMLSNFVSLTGLDYPLFAFLDFSVQALYSHTFPSVELASMKPSDSWLAAGLPNHPISLAVSYEQWAMQSDETRKRLINNGTPQFILENVMLPAWIDCYSAWSSCLQDHQLLNLDQLIDAEIVSHDFMKRSMIPDVERFLSYHPQFASIWKRLDLL